MPLSLLNNRISLSTFRGLINACITAVNTLVTEMATALPAITTLEGEMNTAQADILLKQTAFARSTTNSNYRGAAITVTCVDSDYNGLIHITNLGATTFNLPAPSGLSSFSNGTYVILYNDTTSLSAVTVNPIGSTYLGSTNIVAGEAAHIVKISGTTWLRVPFSK
jgi:hypothetical protein